jgi:hypothetical protein
MGSNSPWRLRVAFLEKTLSSEFPPPEEIFQKYVSFNAQF